MSKMVVAVWISFVDLPPKTARSLAAHETDVEDDASWWEFCQKPS